MIFVFEGVGYVVGIIVGKIVGRVVLVCVGCGDDLG